LVFRREKAMSPTCSAPARSFFRSTAALALLPLAALGCAGKGDVHGRVTYQGKPLVWGTVQFEGSDHLLKQGNINSDGTYTVRGVATGEAKVAVSSINPKSSDFQVRQAEGGPAPKPRPEVKGWFPIPDKYDTPFNSGLSYPIKRGDNQIDIDLK
jgi:hypothetical protein